MEPPVATSGPILRRAATFSHRTERALKDVNGRGVLVNKSQENLSVPKTKVDGQKVARPGKQYSAVASRYAAPLASKKQLSSGADGPHSGNGNVTKLPFITGRSAPQHKRRPSTDNSVQPPMVFAASTRDSKPNTPQKKPEVPSNAVKRPRVVKRASFIEKKPQVQPRPPRFFSLDKGQCSCSKTGMLRGSVDTSETGTASLLYSAAHWVALIKLAEGEKKHEVVLDLFRLAIKLKAEPSEDVVGHLKRYQKSFPGDEVVTQLVQQCEGTLLEVSSTNGEVIDKSVCEPEEPKSTASGPGRDLSNAAPVSETIAVQNEAAVTKDVPKKPPHFMGRMLSRSATFSVVDKSSQSQHAKAEYGKKLAKTVEFLAEQAAAISAAKAGNVAETSPSVIQDRPLDGAVCNSEVSPSFPDVGAKILALAAKLGSKAVAQRGTDKASNPVLGAGSTPTSSQDNGSAEKPVDSLGNWLNGDSSDMGSPGVQSSPREDVVDVISDSKTGLVEQSSPSKTQNATTASLPIVDMDIKSPTTSTVGMIDEGSSKELLTPNMSFISEDQATPCFKVASINVDLSPKLGCNCAAALASPSSTPALSEVGSTREAAGCCGSDEKPVDSLSEWLDGDSSEMVTPEIQSALSEAPVDLSPDRSRAVKLMDVDSLMREVVSHILPEDIANVSVDSQATLVNGITPALESQSVGNNWPETGEQSMTEIVENISRSHRHSLSAEANLLSVPGSVEEKVKLFTVLAEVRGGSPGLADSPESSTASKERHEAEAAATTNDVTSGTTTDADISVETDSAALPSVKTARAVKDSGEAACVTQSSVDSGSRNVQTESSKVAHATPPLRMLTKQRSMKGETVTPFIPSTPSAATPSEPASARNLRSRHRRASSVGNMTPRGPFDISGECSPFADSASSPSGQSSSTKSKRTSRNSKEVTPRIDLPKPSWKSIVEREMKGSKLKDLLATKLPEETSPLAEYVQTQMENQGRDSENGSTVAKETSSPSKRETKLAKSSSKKKSALKEHDQEGVPEPKTAQKLKTLNESEQESVAEAVTPKATACRTPGSAVRRSARLQNRF